MPDHLVSEVSPLFARDDLHQILLDLLGIVMARKFQATGDAIDMSVHYYAFVLLEPGAEHDVGGLPRHAWKREQLIHFGRHLAPKVAHNFLGRSHNGF